MQKIRISIITSLYRCEQYIHSYLKHLSQIDNPDECEVILIHNDPTEEELKAIGEFEMGKLTVNHIKVPREGLYASWNRAVRCSKGVYLTIWNVDDCRLPYSFLEQAKALDNNDAIIAYGDYLAVYKYGDTEGKFVFCPEFSEETRKSFFRNHHIGGFPMWKKEIHDQIGYFDEQFKLIADFDFQIRIAKDYSLIKTKRPLGYFLAGSGSNLSSNYKRQNLEQTVLFLRYGLYDKIDLTYLLQAILKFKIFRYVWFKSENRMPIKVPFAKYIANIPLVTLAFIKLPRHLARKYIKPLMLKYRVN